MDEGGRQYLLKVAREAIARQLGVSPSLPEPSSDPNGEAARPTFVTLTKAGKLRGCVGHTDPSGTLEETVAACAVAAATADPRFPPLRPGELPRVRIEISLLTPPIPIADPADISAGTHGVIVSRGNRRALLLPQVASEHHWTADIFLSQACLKAGLPEDAWRHGARIEVFTAEVFAET